MTAARVVVMTKDPVPGRVKTRLEPALGPRGAADLHRALVAHTLSVAVSSGLPTVVALAGELDGAFAASLRDAGATVMPQADGDLGDRLRVALSAPGRQVCIGTDCPGLLVEDLLQAAEAGGEVVLGPADDGGYWLVAIDGVDREGKKGAQSAASVLFRGIAWSTDQVLQQTLERAQSHGLPTRLLATRRDLDTPSDLAAWKADPALPRALRHALATGSTPLS